MRVNGSTDGRRIADERLAQIVIATPQPSAAEDVGP
jgi:hypothetical protein